MNKTSLQAEVSQLSDGGSAFRQMVAPRRRDLLFEVASESDFFYSLVQNLADSAGAHFAWVAETVPAPARLLKTLAVCMDGQEAENFEYSATDPIAHTVLGDSEICLFPSDVKNHFPGDWILRACDASGYAGIRLVDSQGEVVGMLAVASRHSLRDTRLLVSSLRLFAARAGAELEKRRAAQALQNRAARLGLIFEHAPDAYFVLTFDGKVLEANRSAERLTGYTRAEMTGRNILIPGIMSEEDIRRAATRLRERAGGAPESLEDFTILRRDGSRVVAETHSKIISLDGVQVMLLSVRDITARKLAQEKRRSNLLRNEARLTRTQRIAKVGSWEREIATGKVDWSDEVFRIYGIEKGSFGGTVDAFRDRVHPEDLSRIDAAIEELLLTGDPCRVSFRILLPDGTQRFVREIAELETDASGEPVRLIGSVQDITDVNDLEEKFYAAQRVESLGLLAGGIAHEFGNLLTIIKGRGSLVLQNASNENIVRGGAETILGAAQSASVLIQQLLALSQDQTTDAGILDLNSTVREFDRTLRALLGANIEVGLFLEPELDAVEANRAGINQILLNLALNARDSMSAGRLTIETASFDPGRERRGFAGNPGDGSWVMLTVTATGGGTTEDSRSIPAARMSTVCGLVDRWHGKVHVDSEAGKGTCVRIFLSRAEAAEHVCEEDWADASLRGNETILVVEDQPEVRTLACAVLEQLGYKVLSASSGDAALRLNLEHHAPIDLLLTDVVMPGMAGDTLAERLCRLRPSLKVLCMSGYTADRRIQKSDRGEGWGFIGKPFDPLALAARIRELLGARPEPATILLAEANDGIRGMLRSVLATAGYKVIEAATPAEAAARIRGGAIDLFITDTTPIAGVTTGDLKIIRIADARRDSLPEAIGDRLLTRPVRPDTLLRLVRETFLLKSSEERPIKANDK